MLWDAGTLYCLLLLIIIQYYSNLDILDWPIVISLNRRLYFNLPNSVFGG